MKVNAAIWFKNYKDFKNEWNEGRKSKRYWSSIHFELNEDLDLYLDFKERLRKVFKENDSSYSENDEAKFTDEEYSQMDKFILWQRFSTDRNHEDLAKSYKFTECPACGEYLKVEQVTPLYLSGEVFEEEIIDPEDPGLTRECNMFATNFGEWLVNEKTRRILEEVGIEGIKFEKTTILQENSPQFYQVIIENNIGEIFYPPIKVYDKVCSQCGFGEDTIPTPETIYSNPLNSCCLNSGDWRNWAVKIKSNKNSGYDILRTKERTGFHRRRYHMEIISPGVRNLFLKNGITEFYCTPVNLV